MSEPDPARATWRWNYIPDYEALTTEVLVQRLKTKFGNWKYYVQVDSLRFASPAPTPDLRQAPALRLENLGPAGPYRRKYPVPSAPPARY